MYNYRLMYNTWNTYSIDVLFNEKGLSHLMIFEWFVTLNVDNFYKYKI